MSAWPQADERRALRGWCDRALRDVAVKIQDGTHFSPALGGTDYKYITSRNIGPGYLKLDSVETISNEEHRKIYRRCNVHFGDLLLTKDGANTGNAALSPFHEEVSLLSSVAFIRTNHRYALEPYLLQYLLSASGRKQIVNAMSGNAITRLTLAKINSLIIPLPPVNEQREIASALATLDNQVKTLKRLIAKKEAIKQGMMQQILTGKTRLPGFNDEWTRVKLEQVARFSKGKGLSKSDVLPYGAQPCIHYGELFTCYGAEIATVARRTDRTELPVRSLSMDVLMPTSDVTPRGLAKASAILEPDVILGGDILVIRPTPSQIYAPFLAHAIRRDANQVLSLVRGITVFHLYASDMRHFSVLLPGVEEQEAICAILRHAQSEIDRLVERLTKAQAIKQGMMHELLTGRTRLPVPEAVPG